MGMYVELIGNLTKDPEARTVKVKGEDRRIIEFRVFADEYKKNEHGELEQDDTLSVGVNVTVWNERLGTAVLEHLRKGARVKVDGDLVLESWHDRTTGEKKQGLHVNASSVTLVLTRIETISFRPKRHRSDEPVPA